MASALADPAIPAPTAAGSRRWSDLRTRVISALVLAPLALACLWLGGWAWTMFVLVCGIAIAHEFREMWRRQPSGVMLLAGIVYVLLPVAALIWLREDPAVGRINLLVLLLLVWASDIGAYLVGRWLGGPRLAPAISPGKTWSGAVGGLLGAALVGIGAALAWGGSPLRAAVVAAGLGAVSAAGDLLESGLKRHFGVKDSGRLIPGHGGVLDRLDGLMAAAPAAALLVLALGRGVEMWQ